MSESSDYTDNNWDYDHNFGQERAKISAIADRSYQEAKKKEVKQTDLLLLKLIALCLRPLIFCVDVTGSMRGWYDLFFDRAPYAEYEFPFYLGTNTQICAGAFGDAQNGEEFALQMRPFTTGKKGELKERIKELIHTRKGGNQMMETSELAALYIRHNIELPPGARPVVIFITDEKPHPKVSPQIAKQYAFVTIKKELTTEEIFQDLCGHADVFVICKSYDDTDENSTESQMVYRRWVDLVGADHVVRMTKNDRVIDVTFGILAVATGKLDYFKDEITARQTPEQVAETYRILAPILPKQTNSTPSQEDQEVEDVGSLL